MGAIIRDITLDKPVISKIQHNTKLNGEKVWVNPTINPILSSLYAWYIPKMNNNSISSMLDFSGNNRHASMTGFNSNSYQSDQSLKFSYANRTRFTTPFNMNVFNNGFTLQSVAKFDSGGYAAALAGNHMNQTYGVAFMQWGQTETQLFALIYAPSDSAAGYCFVPGASANFTRKYFDWAMVYDKSTIKVYINGALAVSKSFKSVTFANAPLYIGAGDLDLSDPNVRRYFNGNLKDFKIYTKALTADEILYNYEYNQKTGLI